MNKRPWTIFAAVLFMAGCVNPSVSTIRDTKVAPSYSAPEIPVRPEPLRKDPNAYRNTDQGRTYSLTLKGADIKEVLILLSKESGIPIVSERGINGLVNIEAQNRKLGELLYAILKPLGYTATIENGIIQVSRPQLTARIFRVNYIKDKRNSTSNTNVSGFAANGNSGSVTVSTEGKSDFWGALEGSLEMLVFGTSGVGKREGGGFIRGEIERKIVGERTINGTAQTSGSSSIQGGYDRQSTAGQTTRSTMQTTEVDDPMLQNAQISQNQLKQLVVNETAGIILVTDFSENLDKIASFLADVEEGSKRQVLIQAHIMEVSLKDTFSLGINWESVIDKATNMKLAQVLIPGSTSVATALSNNAFKFSASGRDFSAVLDAMKEQGNVNMLSSPKISALNNQKAVIKLTTKEVSWVSTKTTQNNAIGGQDTFTTTPQIDEVGIFLDVTPQIGQDGSIIMQIHPSVSEIREVSTSPDKTSTKPVINVREIDTMVDAKAGETIVIAGLISDRLSETKHSVPLLGDIPYLGMLFSFSNQERTKSELVIMMTPYILNAKNVDEIRAEHEKRMRDMGGTFHLINNLGSLVTEKSSRDWMMRYIQSFPADNQPVKEPEHVEKAPASE